MFEYFWYNEVCDVLEILALELRTWREWFLTRDRLFVWVTKEADSIYKSTIPTNVHLDTRQSCEEAEDSVVFRSTDS